jgi:hypothetical protein
MKTLLGLGGAAAVAIIAATVISSNRQPVTDVAPLASGYLITELKDHINDVRSVTITIAEDKPVVTLSRSGKGWTVQEKGGYAADTGKLRELLLKLADARLMEAKTTNERHYADLGVEEIKSAGAKGVKVVLSGLASPAELIIGHISAKSGGTFVRRPGDTQSWLANGSLTVDRDPANWIDRAIVDIAPERISEITLTKPGGKPVRAVRDPSTGSLKLADIPAGREAADAVSGLASTLSGLTLEDVMPASSIQIPGNDKLLQAVYRTSDGVKLNMWGWGQDGKHYVRISPILEHSEAESKIQADQAKAKSEFEEKLKADPKLTAPIAVSDPAKDKEQRLAALASEVSELNLRVDGWVYVLPPYKYGNLDKSMDDLLKPAAAAAKTDDSKAERKKPSAKKMESKKK